MADTRKPIGELRKELHKMLIDISVRPSKIKKREELEQLLGMYGKFAEEKKATPPVPRAVGGRKKAMEVPDKETEEGIKIPVKPAKVKTEYAVLKEKKEAKKSVPKPEVAEDSGTGSESEEEERVAKKAAKVVEKAVVQKPKKVLSPEHLAKMRAGRMAMKNAGKEESKPEPSAEPKAEPKKNDAAPRDPYNKLPVFKMP